jgi:hypothetical protein
VWLNITDRARLINLDYIYSVNLERGPDGTPWVLTAVTHTGAAESLAVFSDVGEANRALDRVRHALQTIVLASEARHP